MVLNLSLPFKKRPLLHQNTHLFKSHPYKQQVENAPTSSVTMTLTLVFEQSNQGTFDAYIEEMPGLLAIRGNSLEQVRLDFFCELGQLLNYRLVEDEVVLITKHRLNSTKSRF